MYKKFNATNYYTRGNSCMPVGPAAITNNNKFLPPCSGIYKPGYTKMYRYPASYPCKEDEDLYNKKSKPTYNLPIDCENTCRTC